MNLSLARVLQASTVLVLATACNVTINGGCPEGDAECACDVEGDCPTTVGGGNTVGGGGAGAGGAGGTGGVGGTDGTAIAVAWENLGDDVAPAPDGTLLLTFSSEPLSCGNPHAELPHCEVPITWRADIPLPVESQFVGAVVDLESLDVGYGSFFSVSLDEGDGLCSGGGGTLQGTLEVLAMDASSITVNLSGTDAFEVSLDGPRTFARCGAAPSAEPAIAMTDAELAALYADDGGGSSGQTGGGTEPSQGRLFVFVDASAAQQGLVCTDPYAYDQDCSVERKVVTLGLDPEHQAVGTYAIGDNAISLTTSEAGPNGDGTCWGGGSGGWNEGTVQVLAIDDNFIELSVVGGPTGSFTAKAARCF